MLSLSSCHTAGPRNRDLHFLYLPKETLLLYPSVCSILVYDARTLAFTRVLACWEAFPALRHRREEVKCISVDRGMKLVSAALGNCVTVWSVSTTGVSSTKNWCIHSTLLLADDVQVSALDSKSGLLVVGSTDSLSVYTLILENDLPTWSLKWTSIVPTPSLNRLAPSLMYIAVTSAEDDNCSVKTYSLTSGTEIQHIPHPRPVTDIIWRFSEQTSRDDLVLYTITNDSTLRIFLPVIDSPTYLQLSAAIDTCSNLSSPKSGLKHHHQIFALNREAISASLSTSLSRLVEDETGEREGQIQRVREIAKEGWDLFAKVESNGEVIIQALANIDRRPPTLLTLLTLQHTLPQTLPKPPTHLYISSPYDVAGVHAPGASHSSLPIAGDGSLLLITSPPIRSYSLFPFEFFDTKRDGLQLKAQLTVEAVQRNEEISRLIRTSEGHGLGVYWKNGGGEIYNFRSRTRSGWLELLKTGGWHRSSTETSVGDLVAVLNEGRNIAIYECHLSMLTLYSAKEAVDRTTQTTKSSIAVPSLASLFSLPQPQNRSGTLDQRECLVGITLEQSVVFVSISSDYSELVLLSQANLPTSSSKLRDSDPQGVSASIIKVIPVDPMAWADTPETLSHDLLLSVDSNGQLEYWVFDEDPLDQADCVSSRNFWTCTGRVRTGRKNIRLVKCSSIKKTVLVAPCEGNEEEITIWDSKESQFASGLEYKAANSTADPIVDLDWSSTPDGQSILAIGFAHHVDILCPHRTTYFDEGYSWIMCCRIDLTRHTPYPISDSLWLSDGSLLIGAGHEIFLYGQGRQQCHDDCARVTAGDKTHGREESLFEYVAQSNGPLPDYHPQMLLQCLLWGKLELVKEIIMNLARDLKDLRQLDGRSSRDWKWTSLPMERFFGGEWQQTLKSPKLLKKRYSNLFNGPNPSNDEEEVTFSRPLLTDLMDFLEHEPFPHLTPNEQTSLLAAIQTVLEIDEQRRSLDSNGLRYLISMRSFYIINHRARSSPDTPLSVNGVGQVPRRTGARERLRYRDMIWAHFSDSQELLLGQCSNACRGKMVWSDAKALGVSIWLKSVDSLKAQMEAIARNEYMAGDARDPVACSLFYFALGKVKLVHGLWRSAASHKEQAMTLKFLSNDFSQDRWKKAAMKNAYALLGKQRFEYAAAFFLLGGSLKDAVKVCVRNLSDFQLAIALARVVEQRNDGPVFLDIVRTAVIPAAFKHGNRWLICWAFWKLHRRDLAVRVLLTPLQDIANTLDIPVAEVVESTYDDTSLALLFSQLRSRTLQAAKGTSEISGQTEFSFIIQIARVFVRMGCHALALDLLRSWSFERPTAPQVQASPVVAAPPMVFAMHARRPSMYIDMEVTSLPPTRRASPEPESKVPPVIPEEITEEGDLLARKAGIGSLMKQAKTHVQVPEFDMGAFF